MAGRGGQRDGRPAPGHVSAGQWFDALDRAGPGASPAAIAAALGCHPDSVRRYRRRFGSVRSAELPAARPRPRARVDPVRTDPPRARAPLASDVSARPVGDPLAELAHVLPSAHLAMVRLLAAAIVARWHLPVAGSGTGGRPAFAAFGAGGRGKTTLAELVRHAFGWLAHWPVVIPLHGVQAGELAGRRAARGGRWHFDPAPYLALPFVCCDELDKARSAQVRNEAFGLVGCDGAIVREGTRVDVRPVVLTTFNLPAKGPSQLLTTQWRRRTIGLDVDRAELPERELVAAWLDSAGPRFDLDALRPAPASSADASAVLAELRAKLSDDGWHHVETRMVPELLSGWTAIRAVDPVGELLAALLTLAGTRGELRGTRRASASVPGPTAAQQAAEARTRALEFAGLQAPAVAELARMARLMRELADDPDLPELHGQARTLAGQLGELRRMTAAAASVDDLRAIAELPAAQTVIVGAEALWDYAAELVGHAEAETDHRALPAHREHDDQDADDVAELTEYRPGLVWMPPPVRPLPATEPGTGRLIGSRRLTLGSGVRRHVHR